MVETRTRRESRSKPERCSDRILIVDDEELIRDTLAEYLTQEGFQVTACGSVVHVVPSSWNGSDRTWPMIGWF